MDKQTIEIIAILALISFVFIVPVFLASIVYYTKLNESISPGVSIDPKNVPPDSNWRFSSSKNEGKITGEKVQILSLAFIIVSTLLSSYAFAKGRSLKNDRAIMYSAGFLVTSLLVFFLAQFALREIFKSLMSI